jgi:hypothetical protein
MTSLIPSGLDDLLCLPKRLHIVIAARKKTSLADLCRDAGDIKGAYRHQAYTLARANYITIDLSSSHPPSLFIETTALGRKQLTKHIAAVHTLMRSLGVTEPVSTAIPRRRNNAQHPAPALKLDHRHGGDHANSATTELLRALEAVRQHLPHTVDDILRGQMTPDRQHEFADLLFELGRLLHRDAAIEEAVHPTSANVIAPGTQPPRNTLTVVAHKEEQP